MVPRAEKAGLAHKLDTRRLMSKIDTFLQGKPAVLCCAALWPAGAPAWYMQCSPISAICRGCGSSMAAASRQAHHTPRVRACLLASLPAAGRVTLASMQELLATLHLAHHCQLEGQLAVAGRHFASVVQEEALAALDSATLACLLGKTMQRACNRAAPPAVMHAWP